MYEYEKQKAKIFTDEGQRDFLGIRDKAQHLLKLSGVFRMGHVFGSGDAWHQMACVDRMVELGEIVEVPRANVRGQDRVFVAPPSSR